MPVPFDDVEATDTVYWEPFVKPVRVFVHTPAVQSEVLAVVVEVVAPSTYFTEYSVMEIPVAFETLGH